MKLTALILLIAMQANAYEKDRPYIDLVMMALWHGEICTLNIPPFVNIESKECIARVMTDLAIKENIEMEELVKRSIKTINLIK